ncbi:MAG: helix-turn-helix domain-containing protein, partial [Gammaproteobacteria bacterium]
DLLWLVGLPITEIVNHHAGSMTVYIYLRVDIPVNFVGIRQGPAVLPSSLPMNLIESRDGTETPETSSDLGLREKLNLFEKEILLDTLLRANGIKKQAAAMLGIDPRNMPYLLRKHRLRDGLRSN